MTMTGIKTNSDRSSTGQFVLRAAMSLVLVLVMVGQGVVQAAGIGMSGEPPSTVSDSLEVPLEHDHRHSHEHPHSHEHDGSAQAEVESDTTSGTLAHHGAHTDGSGCCPMSVCGSACSGVCSGSGVGVAVTSAEVPTLSGLSSAIGTLTDGPVAVRAPGVPFRPPIPRQLGAG